MPIKKYLQLLILMSLSCQLYAQDPSMLAQIRREGLLHSQAKELLHTLTDVYGQRLTGSREYLAAAKWTMAKMKEIGLENVHFENFCKDCRGWSIKGFNVEMVAPNFMHIMAYPLAMTKSTPGIVEGDVVNIDGFGDMKSIREKFAGKLKGKIILLGKEPRLRPLTEPILKRYTSEELAAMEQKLTPKVKPTALPEELESWKTSDHMDKDFLAFAEEEGALAVLKSQSQILGILGVGGTYNYLASDPTPLPYFSIMPEHFGRLLRMLEDKVTPRIRLNLETELYTEPDNNVNIIGEIPGTDPQLAAQTVLVGGHFDSWHSGTGATDNGVSCTELIEALRILKQTHIAPRRTIRIGLWGGEEQAFIGSVAYAIQHYGPLREAPNADSKKVTAYLNLDNGAGA
ncbi:MAG: M28 family peptidase, partial [Bacteroidota bacterium]|nr:M28 family peptidase [Bacteroidota bacterium]